LLYLCIVDFPRHWMRGEIIPYLMSEPALIDSGGILDRMHLVGIGLYNKTGRRFDIIDLLDPDTPQPETHQIHPRPQQQIAQAE
jgi:hypothetical protein